MIRVDIRLYLNPLSHRHAAAARTTGSHRATNTICRKSASDSRAAGTVCWATSNAWAVCPVRDWVSDAHGWSCCGISGSAKEQTRSRTVGYPSRSLGDTQFLLGVHRERYRSVVDYRSVFWPSFVHTCNMGPDRRDFDLDRKHECGCKWNSTYRLSSFHSGGLRMGFKAKARKAKVAEGKPKLKKRRKKVVTKVESDCEDQGCSGCCPPSPSRPVA